MVDILDLGPVPQEQGPVAGQGWGYTGIFATVNGGGFLTDEFPDAYKAVWDFQGQVATSRHLPGVRFTGITHPGIVGTAPSHEMLNRWNSRERELISTDPDRVPLLALPPNPQNALLGSMTGDESERAAQEAARTAPPRENGGNQDIKNLSRGSRVYLPVYVEGAKFSAVTCTSARATVRSRSAARSRWAATSTSTSISSRAAWRRSASRPTRCSCRATSSRATASS